MNLTVGNLTKANEEFRSREAWKDGQQYELEEDYADGALYLPLTEECMDIAKLSGTIPLKGHGPVIMVVGEWPVYRFVGANNDEDLEPSEDGFAVQFYSKAADGMMSGYETFDSFDELVAYLAQYNIPVGSDNWFGAPRAW